MGYCAQHRKVLARQAPGDRSASGAPASAAVDRPAEAAQDAPWILCRACRRAVTRLTEALDMNGAPHHTFANPHGIVFEIGCFRSAPGCMPVGGASAEFSWFSGYRWRVALCGRCLGHLGWRFEQGDSFYGLILDRLLFPA